MRATSRPSQSLCISARLNLRRRQALRPFGTPRCGACPHFTAIRYSAVTREPVLQSPNPPQYCGGIESKEGISPSSAQRSVTSPIRGMTLHRAERSGGSFAPHPGQQKHRGLAPPNSREGGGPTWPFQYSTAARIVGILISCSQLVRKLFILCYC
jgi:hypothetical protein